MGGYKTYSFQRWIEIGVGWRRRRYACQGNQLVDFAHSERSQDLTRRLAAFMRDEVVPAESTYAAALSGSHDWRQWRQPPVMETLKAKARAAGLWNLFLPEPEHGAGLSNVDYAPLAELMGRSFIAPEVFNCSAPDSGNMEVLVRYGSAEQKARWLAPPIGRLPPRSTATRWCSTGASGGPPASAIRIAAW
jgi:alkylation response protein AidB-like acyl-CoA dehydrogenase